METFQGRTCWGTALIVLLLPISGIWCFSELFFTREPQDVIVLRKDPVVLDCQARGELPITIVWMKNSLKLVDNERIYILSNGSLYITEVEHRKGERSDEGFYECLAQNKYGAILSQKSHLSVASMSPFEVQPAHTVVNEGEVARFICKIHANPPPIITWEFNRTALPLATDRITALPTGVLQIYGVEARHAGQYRCVATNVANRRRSMEAILTVIPVPLAPELRLEPLNCTTITVSWRQAEENSVHIQGYRLFYREESQQETGPIGLGMQDSHYTISGLDPRRKYHMRLLAYNYMGEGYQADQTVSTPGCVSVRDRMVPPPPPPHHLYAKANSSSSIFLQWGKPAFTAAAMINYTVRCNPVGLQNASLVMYLQTSETHMLVHGLQPFTKYEFAVRLHADQLSSPWSPVVYQLTLPEAPVNPPSSVKVTLIEEGTALISWKPPEDTNTAITRYTILYASRKAWIAGEWQMLHREGTITMALLENLLPGNVYLIQISASNEVGEGPFSNAIELAIPVKETIYFSQGPKWPDSRNSGDAKVNSDVFYHLDQKSMTGIIVGVCIALTCIIICVLILLYRSKARKSSAIKAEQQGNVQMARVTRPLVNTTHIIKSQTEQETVETLMPMMPENVFLDTKGGSDMIIRSSTHVNKKVKKWSFFGSTKKSVKMHKEKQQPVRRHGRGMSSYQLTGLICEESGASILVPPTSLRAVFGTAGDAEYSHNSDGSHETGDSGRYSHDSREEMEMAHLSSVTCTTPTFLGPFIQAETASVPVPSTSEEAQCLLIGSPSATSDLLASPEVRQMPSSKTVRENTDNEFPV
ncbi:protogenin A [Rhincodon typus]|uniref:protogenin A n=1 Tax=Rhincodon typus TaxID=259920 RepID=UPI00202EC5A4|nr:protogenin A [Rhincodon typus]